MTGQKLPTEARKGVEFVMSVILRPSLAAAGSSGVTWDSKR